ncbi:unnamed protein product [Kuraishia capsulata CBS 1993]|uniref:Uncharacterized protein n=1 Tax=Kuraishia capsulata CBS 1993 TaxID=1382522 RepID=W6MK40_9ASCO|nr:uncharacterized protein KUCA_T00002884001 [Kuraishia capsulata CBS 1993]CDK26909.1 unnamed protein product [Kuraishia capsulata CBS 1993]
MSATTTTQAPRRGHFHKRSSAISGDFDVSFFMPPQQQLGNNSSNSLSVNGSSRSNQSSLMSRSVPSSVTSSPLRPFDSQSIENTDLPIVQILTPDCSELKAFAPPVLTTPATPASPPTRFFVTEEAQIDRFTNIPDAVINLDDILNLKTANTIKHKRTGSAPELENFFNPPSSDKRFTLGSPQRTENPIVEDIEEEDEDELRLFGQSDSSSLASNCKLTLDNSSNQSLNSNNSSLQQQQQQQNPRISGVSSINTPSINSLRGKVRYQSYYNNQLSSSTPNSLKRSSLDSCNNNKENLFLRSSRSLQQGKSLMPPPSSLGANSNSNSRSPVRNSVRFGSGLKTSVSPFQYESVPYDIPKGFHRDHGYSQSLGSFSQSSSQSASQSAGHSHSSSRLSISRSRSPVKKSTVAGNASTVASKREHKKSNSLFNSLSSRFHRRNSSSKTHKSKNSIIYNELMGDISPESTGMDTTLRNDDTTIIHNDDDLIFGEPGPMVTKNVAESNGSLQKTELLQVPPLSKPSRLFGWMRKRRESNDSK